MDSAHDSVLMRLMARIGAPIASPIFPPFARGVFNFDDAAWMSRALALARRQLGRVAPNPAVGCVLVHGRDTFAEAATGDGGRPHAEEAALDEAGAAAKGATAYVTLEPCSARSAGGTSCTQRLIEARVARVVIACREPNPASACGAEVLRQAGVAVTDSVLEGEAEHLNRGFFKRLRTGRPWTVVQDEGDGQDVECALHPGETPDAMLDRLGSSGQTRVFARPGSAEAAALAMAGLVDQYGADED
jgi:diaminohydroxyphosphoribosylaminopyrimidine deaminase/5-amino-6-(5-phosphoribosylamino)uracil reductase